MNFGELFVVESTGGAPRKVELLNVAVASYPVWTPDGRHLLFLGVAAGEGGRAVRQPTMDWWVAPIEGGKAVPTKALDAFRGRGFRLDSDDVQLPTPTYWVEDRVVFSGQVGDGRNVWQVRLSPKRWEVMGDPERLTSGTSLEVQPSMAAESEGPSGARARLVYASLTSTFNIWSLPTVGDQGKAAGDPQRLTSSAYDGQSSLSEDGKRLAYVSSRSGNLDIWLRDLDSGKETALTVGPADEFGPEITPDGTKVFYQVVEDQRVNFYAMPVGPGGQAGVAQRVCDGCLRLWDPSSDGRKILFIYAVDPIVSAGLLDVDTGRKIELLKHPKYVLVRLRFSPDDRWISLAGMSVSGRARVYIVPFRETSEGQPATGEEGWVTVTEDEGFYDKPVWSPDGNLLYFASDQDGSRCIWAQRLDPGTKRPVGSRFAVYHSHSARRSLLNADILKWELSVAPDKLIFHLGEITGNIWMATLP